MLKPIKKKVDIFQKKSRDLKKKSETKQRKRHGERFQSEFMKYAILFFINETAGTRVLCQKLSKGWRLRVINNNLPCSLSGAIIIRKIIFYFIYLGFKIFSSLI